MFRRLASCSRGGLDMTDKTLQKTKDVEIFWPQKVKVGSKDFEFGFKKSNPNGVFPPFFSHLLQIGIMTKIMIFLSPVSNVHRHVTI